MAEKTVKKSKKKEKKKISFAQAHIRSSFNNTMIAITDTEGNVLAWDSAGTVGFKGSRKGTPFAAQVAAESVAKKAKEFGVQRVEVFTKGPGSGRDTAIKTLQSNGINVGNIVDKTPVPYNGPRLKKRRRV
ncbi:hypothetical protein LCGC14_0847850 [marine sediment metagenome]|uniref:30S ribosomal protein S11 n=1 Tax=marine sediment metagenome TaxID=412755 RepID=A0A0F9SI96_9ZZZZ|nr:30S ribosomal protein S11 [Actinomycetota bacterium]